jgi:hypothetical protein
MDDGGSDLVLDYFLVGSIAMGVESPQTDKTVTFLRFPNDIVLFDYKDGRPSA